MASVAHQFDRELSTRLMTAVYQLSDGRALCVYERGRGVLCASAAELREAMKKPWVARDPWEEWVDDLAAFASQAEKHASDLGKKIGVSAGLDGTLYSLRLVDAAIRRLGPKRTLAKDVFVPLLAYVGEVIRRETGAQWQLRESGGRQSAGVGYPGGEWSPVLGIYKQVLENGRNASLHGFVSFEVLFLKRSRPWQKGRRDAQDVRQSNPEQFGDGRVP